MRTLPILLLAAAAALAAGCYVAVRFSTLDFVELKSGVFAQRADSGIVLIFDAPRLESLWREAGIPGDPPEVDFSRDMVVGYFMGRRATGGYSTGITGIESSGTRVRVSLEMIEPAPGCPVTQSTTSPFVFVRTTRQWGTPEVGNVTTRRLDCR